MNKPVKTDIRERGAVGKAILVYLGTGSVLAAGLAYLLFTGMGC